VALQRLTQLHVSSVIETLIKKPHFVFESEENLIWQSLNKRAVTLYLKIMESAQTSYAGKKIHGRVDAKVDFFNFKKYEINTKLKFISRNFVLIIMRNSANYK
jgi:hypothetical protein